MALNVLGRLDMVFRFQDRSATGTASAQNNIKKLETTATSSANRMRNAFLGAFPAFLTINIFRMIGQAVMGFTRPAIQMQESMRRLAVFANVGTLGMKGFEDSATSAAKTISMASGYSMPQLIDSMTELSKKGLEGRDALAAIVPVVQMSRLANLDLSESVDVAATLVKVWGFRNKELQERMSQLAFVSKKSRLDFDELRDVITRTTTGVKLAAPAYEDFLFMVAKTRDVAPTARIAGTQLRRAMEQLALKSRELGADLGVPIKNMKAGATTYRSVSELLWDVAKSTTDANVIQRKFEDTLRNVGVRAATPFVAIISSAREAIEAAGGNVKKAEKAFFGLRQEIEKNKDTLNKMFRDFAKNNLALQIDILKVAWENLAIAMGPTLLTPLQRLVVGVTGIIERVSNAITSVSDFVDGLGEVGKWLKAGADWFSRFGMGIFLFVAVMGIGRAGLQLLGSAIAFSTAGVRSAAAAWWEYSVATVAAARANIAVASSGKKVTATLGLMRVAIRGIKVALGPLGLILLAASFLMDAVGFFGDKVDEMEKVAREAGKGGDRRIQKLRDAGDLAAANLLEAAKRMEGIFKVKPARFDAGDIKRVDEMLARLKAIAPIVYKEIGGGLEVQAGNFKKLLTEMVVSGKGFGALSKEQLKAFNESTVIFKVMEDLVGDLDPRLAEFAKRNVEAASNLRKMTPEHEAYVNSLERLRAMPAFAAAKKAGTLPEGVTTIEQFMAGRPEFGVTPSGETKKIERIQKEKELTDAINAEIDARNNIIKSIISTGEKKELPGLGMAMPEEYAMSMAQQRGGLHTLLYNLGLEKSVLGGKKGDLEAQHRVSVRSLATLASIERSLKYGIKTEITNFGAADDQNRKERTEDEPGINSP